MIVGIKYNKNIDKLLDNHSLGFINIFQINAVKVNKIATTTENQGATSGLGSFALRTFNKILPIQNKLITAKNEIEYTQANSLTFPPVSNKIEIHRIKNNIIILYELHLSFLLIKY
jgi:hypothetical protein